MRKIILTLTAFILALLPFIIGVLIGKYSPYIETNSFEKYVLIWALISIILGVILFVVTKFFYQSLNQPTIYGAILFLIVSPIIGIIGLAAPPDLSLKMLEHPEREHFRYILLTICSALFGVLFLFLNRSNIFNMDKKSVLIMNALFILNLIAFLWEFSHHYLYPEGLKEWVSRGGNAEDFTKNYDNSIVITIGAISRYIEFSLLLWVSILFYKIRKVRIWAPIIIVFFSLMGIISATAVLITQMKLPKQIEILFLFFIPGIPFLLYYWLGVALLTRSKK